MTFIEEALYLAAIDATYKRANSRRARRRRRAARHFVEYCWGRRIGERIKLIEMS